MRNSDIHALGSITLEKLGKVKPVIKVPIKVMRLDNVHIDCLMRTSKVFRQGTVPYNPFLECMDAAFEFRMNDRVKRSKDLNTKDIALLHLINERVIIDSRLAMMKRSYRRGMTFLDEAQQNEFIYTDKAVNEFIEDIEIIDAQLRLLLNTPPDSMIMCTHAGYPFMHITVAIFSEKEYAHFDMTPIPVMHYTENQHLRMALMHGAELDAHQEAYRKASEYVERHKSDIIQYERLGSIYR